MSTDVLETRTENDRRGLIPEKAVISLDESTCTFMIDIMHRVATDESYMPYGVKKDKCPSCDGHDVKCKGYMKRTTGLEIVNELKKLYE
ncbi:hypothetical protein GOV12_04765 [Candidatus Pacearchaeota archaeon]|nr:hypothetical protein [Candidatus Pacearchaeota archaeon]